MIPEKYFDIGIKPLTNYLISQYHFVLQRNSICASLSPSFARSVSKLIWNPQDEPYKFKVPSPLDMFPAFNLLPGDATLLQWLLWLQDANTDTW